MAKKSMIEHSNDLMNLLVKAEQYHEVGEDIPTELEEQISNALIGQSKKVDRCVAFMNRCEAQQKEFKAEIAAYKAGIERLDRWIERMKDASGFAMQLQSTDEAECRSLDGDLYKIWKKKNEGADIVDEALVPDEYKIVETVVKIDKKQIVADVKKGVTIPGVKRKVTDSIHRSKPRVKAIESKK